MFSRVRVAIRFFFVGLAVGVLLAPRSGEQTRRLLREKADRLLNDILDAASLGTYESGAGSVDTGDDPVAPKRAARGNGTRSRARTTAASATEEVTEATEAATSAGS
jgi:gas vesicle protein